MHQIATRQNRIRIIVITGATATGKSTLAIQLAKLVNAEIVNADSRLVYRGMDIGTAKPTTKELHAVPHHIINIIEPQQPYSLNQYLNNARKTIQNIAERTRIPIIVGGSGQYIWGLLEGWQVPEIPPNQKLRNEMEQLLRTQGLQAIQNKLHQLDPKGAQKIELLNPRRVIRAIERASATGDALGGASKADTPPFNSLIIGLTAPREIIHKRIAERLHIMLQQGWIHEVQTMLDRGIDTRLPAMSAIGYRQIAAYINGQIDLQQMQNQIIIATHKLVGAQNNWFKPTDKRINWLDITKPDLLHNATNLTKQLTPPNTPPT